MRRKLVALMVFLLGLFGVAAVEAPSASALCTGAPGCASGWYGTTVHDNPTGREYNANIDIVWDASTNYRTFYFSGSTYFAQPPTYGEAMDSMTLFYRVHCGTCRWIAIASDVPGPAYGTYAWLNFAGWSTPRDFVVNGCYAGRCINSPIIYN